MKSISYFLSLFFVFALCISCEDKSFLDETVTTDLNADVVFADSTYTVGFLSGIYTDVGFDTDPGRFSSGYSLFGGIQGACDEVEYKVSATITPDVLFATGTVNPVVISADAWEVPYRNIRRVNIFLKNVDHSPLSLGKRTTYKAEARFLRAWYYFILLKHYGGVPLIGDTVYQSPDDIKPVRNTFEECVNYITTECDMASHDLVVKPSGRSYGRVGAGASKALKARVLLYAASPLYNGSNYAPDNYQKELLGYPVYNKERWKLAMEAAKDLIQMGNYSLYVKTTDDNGSAQPGLGYYRVFVAADWASDGSTRGTIFEFQGKKSLRVQQLFCPPSRGSSSPGGFPYQDLVDAYPMIDGSKFDWDNPTEAAAPYANRDPRLYNSVVLDQTPMQNGSASNVPVNTFLNQDGTPYDQDGVHTGTPTGYYIRKMIHRLTASNWVAAPTQARPLMRYAEVLLNYAEAANEYEGPSQQIYDALTSVRDCGGIQPGADSLYGLKPNMTQVEMREAIRLERRVEFAFEGFRFWDVRRWMIADDTENKMLTGLEVRKVGSQKTYTRFNVRQHVFRKAMYFWPIPNSEVAKSPTLVQNPYY
ncbi:MAG: RagB/SusD family nutrient uptake outer membrane protein [Paludibacter sp.]|nr:RagB/SusD family nutrient uptake outer membrane protein [Paludibacter sp.]